MIMTTAASCKRYLALVSLVGMLAAALPAAADQVIKIGSDFPVSGADSADGIPVQNAIQLAIDDANKRAPKGYRFELLSMDDAVGGVHNPQQGASNIRSFAADPNVLGVIGPFNSNVAAAQIPVSNEAQLAQISPATTNPTLTKTTKYRTAHPGDINFFQVPATDDVQGRVLAQLAMQMSLKRVYVLDDNETYGKGLADEFDSNLRKLGGTVLGHDHVTSGQQDFKGLLTKVAATHPSAVFFGGCTSTGGGLIRTQMTGAGLDPQKIPLLGGDCTTDDAFLKIAGSAANNTYYTAAAPNPEKMQGAHVFVKEYASRFHSDLGAYSASGYAAGQIMIAAIEQALKSNDNKLPTRAEVLSNLRHAKDVATILGPFGFDKNGLTTTQIFSIWKIEGGKRAFVKQVTFRGDR
ncbi:branched-chain amino acid ABC transporter substrate-binding protein [bacterium]|nr:MAG: branched-chain amino acid ABC transporter substrate-binding protein [bacterium]